MNLLVFCDFEPKKCFRSRLHGVCMGRSGTSAGAVYALFSRFCYVGGFGDLGDPVVHTLRGVSGDVVTTYAYPPPPLYKLRPCPSYSRRRDRNNCVHNFNYVRNVVRPHKTWVCRHICQLHGAMDTCNMPHARQIYSQEFEVVRFVHPYHARAHVCVGRCMCFAQATPLSKLQWA